MVVGAVWRRLRGRVLGVTALASLFIGGLIAASASAAGGLPGNFSCDPADVGFLPVTNVVIGTAGADHPSPMFTRNVLPICSDHNSAVSSL